MSSTLRATNSNPHRCRRRYDWTGVDLSRAAAVIAAELGCSREAVHQRRALLKRLQEHGRKPRSPFDWPNVDWSKTNTAIAAKLGCTPNCVAAKRRKYASPEHRAARMGAPSAADQIAAAVLRLHHAASDAGQRVVHFDPQILARAVNVETRRNHPLYLDTIITLLPRVVEILAARGHRVRENAAKGYDMEVTPGLSPPDALPIRTPGRGRDGS